MTRDRATFEPLIDEVVGIGLMAVRPAKKHWPHGEIRERSSFSPFMADLQSIPISIGTIHPRNTILI